MKTSMFVAVCLTVCFWTSSATLAQTSPPRVAIVVGPSSHPPGTHEEAAGARLMKYCLENMIGGPSVTAQVWDQWPDDLRRLILNGIVWTAQMEVPATGVRTELPDLAAFETASVDPLPRPARAKAQP
jgi:hypothetical protein